MAQDRKQGIITRVGPRKSTTGRSGGLKYADMGLILGITENE
ncbi:hypothetical protein ES707_11618 [subsurface metagenome]